MLVILRNESSFRLTVAEKDQRCAIRRNEQPAPGRVECGQRKKSVDEDDLKGKRETEIEKRRENK